MPIDLTRSLLVILIPGLVAIAPWVLLLVQHTSATLGFDKYVTLGSALVFALSAVAGSVFEGIASSIEVSWDLEREEEYQVAENWFAYLAHVLPHEPVAFRYLSRMATTMYFELSMLFAVPLFLVGGGILASLRFPFLVCVFLVTASLFTVISIAYFRVQARRTHLVLCKTRRELNCRVHNRIVR